jgi:hypothetical protein
MFAMHTLCGQPDRQAVLYMLRNFSHKLVDCTDNLFAIRKNWYDVHFMGYECISVLSYCATVTGSIGIPVLQLAAPNSLGAPVVHTPALNCARWRPISVKIKSSGEKNSYI